RVLPGDDARQGLCAQGPRSPRGTPRRHRVRARTSGSRLDVRDGRATHAARRDVPPRAVGFMTESVQFFFDPICPWAYQASKWIRDVRAQTELDVEWRFFSLEEINREEGKKHPWERPWSFGWGQMRVGALIRRELGNDELDRWYAGIGE